ncbi:MAG: IS1634 family transposase, partial [Christensenellaceae bacterium]|nr:IS1634 family transposase [Christensenellaceae bacterium]
MAYFLKKSKQNGKLYLAICESFYEPEKKATAHKCYKSLGNTDSLIKNGISDPIAHFQKEVDKLNSERRLAKVEQVSNESPLQYLGYFPFVAILEKLNVKKYIDFFKLTTDFQFDLFELLSSLIYARIIYPCSKHKTFHEVINRMCTPYDYSYDQLLNGLSFLGNTYEKIIEIFTRALKNKYGINTEKTYFDCINFYFEIDKEDDFRIEGPSKENRKDPIVGMGLLLDSNQMPIGMKLYPGNESEKPILRDVIQLLKMQNNITGETVHVADEGPNCAQNIVFSKENGDGYLFSKSVKGLSEKEKVWVLKTDDWLTMKSNKGAVLYYYKSCIDEFPYTIVHEGKNVNINFTEKRLLTLNPELRKKQIFEINKQVEKAKNLTCSLAKKEEYGDSAKYVCFTDTDGKKARDSINQDAIDKDKKFAGYNLLVTSEIKMTDSEIYSVYHNLWRIEESFRIMKSDMDARPVFLQKESTIKGHFLICYLTVLLERILQFKTLGKKYSSCEILSFMRNFVVLKTGSQYINTAIASDILTDMSNIFSLPATNYYLSKKQVNSFLG